VRLRDFIPPEATLISVARVIGVLSRSPSSHFEWTCGSLLGTQFNAIRNPRLEFLSCKYLYLLDFYFRITPPLAPLLLCKINNLWTSRREKFLAEIIVIELYTIMVLWQVVVVDLTKLEKSIFEKG
jgi:hypothetical protein